MVDLNSLLQNILGTGGVSSLILVGVLYWLFRYYIPSRDLMYRETLSEMQKTFVEALNKITLQQEAHNSAITTRLGIIADDIKRIQPLLERGK